MRESRTERSSLSPIAPVSVVGGLVIPQPRKDVSMAPEVASIHPILSSFAHATEGSDGSGERNDVLDLGEPDEANARKSGSRTIPFTGIPCPQVGGSERTMLNPSDPPEPAWFKVGVVLPVFSETDSVRAVTEWLRDHLGARLEEILIVISPRSQERSLAICQELAGSDLRIRVHVQQRNPGLGHAVREGLERVRGDAVLIMDSDGEMENETVTRMLAKMDHGTYDLVVASRWIKGGGFSGYGPLKYWLNKGFQSFFRLLFRTQIHDLTYGFKLMRGELARGIMWEGTLHEIACETTLKPLRLGARVTEVPSRWTARSQGQSKNAFLRNFRYVGMAWRILVGGRPTMSPAGALVAGQTRV